MSICCVVCGLWYVTADRDTLDICTPCLELNFAALFERREQGPTAREALEAFVSSAHQLRPHQHAAWEDTAC